MKITKKKIISPPPPETFTKITPNTFNPYEIFVSEKVSESSRFIPDVNGADVFLPDPEIVAGPTGPQGPPGEGRYFYGPSAPTAVDIQMGERWFDTVVGTEYIYIPIAEGSTYLEWVDMDHLGTLGGFVWDSNKPTSATNLEGVPEGTTFSIGTSSIEVLKSILYPRFLEFTEFTTGINLGPYHIGDATISGTYISSWTIQDVDEAQPNSLRIFQGSTSLIEGYPLTSVSDVDGNTADILHPSYYRTSEGNVTFTVSITSNNGNTISDAESIRWNYPLYTGKSSLGELTSESDFLSLGAISTSNPHISYTLSEMKTGITKQYSATSSPQYLFWAIPKSVDSSPISGFPVYSSNASFTDITNPNTTQSVPVQKQNSSVTFMNYGLNIEFDVYRTVVAFANARTIRVAE